MGLILANNASATIAGGLSATSTTVSLASGQGSAFPVLQSGDWHPMTLVNPDGTYEIVRVTGRSGDVLTIERAQEGTAAITFQSGAAAGIRLTRAALEQFALSGQENFTVLRGINYAVSTGVIGSSVYNVNMDNIAAYTNNLRLSILPHSGNDSGTPTINVNSLGNVNIELPDGTIPQAGAILANRVMNLRYRSASNAFVLDNAIGESEGLATEISAGLAQRGVEETFDPDGGNNSKFTTQLTVSRIIENSRPPTESLPPMWNFKGDERHGGTFIANAASPGGLSAGLTYSFENMDIQSSGTLTFGGEGVAVVRATGSITVNGNIVMPRGNLGKSQHVGGSGSSTASGTRTRARSHLFSGGQGEGERLTAEQFYFNVLNGTPMAMFQGGHGGAANTGVQENPGGGGLIMIATTIDIQAGANFSNMYSESANFQGASAGGMLVIVANSITIDGGATFEAGAQGSSGTRTDWAPASTPQGTPGAANGQCFILSLNTALPDQIF